MLGENQKRANRRSRARESNTDARESTHAARRRNALLVRFVLLLEPLQRHRSACTFRATGVTLQ